jgi:hypothetical protein
MPFPQDYVRGFLFEPGVLKVANGVSFCGDDSVGDVPEIEKNIQTKRLIKCEMRPPAWRTPAK